MLAPLGTVYQAGTLSGNPLACTAAIATLEILSDPTCYQQLEQTSALLADGLAKAAADAAVPVTINRVGSIMSIFFTDKPVRNYADVQATNAKQFKKFFAAMLDSGIYLAPSAYEAMFVSLAHTQKDVEKTIAAARYSFKRITA